MSKEEKELINSTKEFANLHNLTWNEGVETMVINAYRQGIAGFIKLNNTKTAEEIIATNAMLALVKIGLTKTLNI